jgi:DNA-binding PadR family transcriptional regulator
MTESCLPLTPLSHANLLALAEDALHGYAIMKAIETETGGAVRPGTGTLYAALQRMEDDGMIEERPAPGDEGDARRRYYGITSLGRSVATAEANRLASLLELAARKRLGPEGVA